LNSNSFSTRPARSNELERLNEIERSAAQLFRTIGNDLVADSEPLALDRLRACQESGHLWVVVTGDNLPVGFVAVEIVDGLAHIEEISVHADYGKQGLGSRLIELVCDWACQQGYPAVTLSTYQDVPWNAPFYARRGFRILAEGELSPGLQAVRAHEAADGLDPGERVCMRREL
jgi:ribosomal protein S18 acetylase RimI-like enzyme